MPYLNFDDVPLDPRVANAGLVDADALRASNMGSLRRGWETGRIGNEMNPLNTEALDAELAGNAPKAAGLRARVEQLKEKQAKFAPEVGRVEDIHGIGDGLSWAGTQLGQGAASMADPMAVSAGLNTVGRIAGAIPHPLAQGVGKAAQLAGLAIPALMSKQQLTGEFIGEAQQDEALMARTSPQALRDTAGNYGTIAAIPDSFLPGMIGRQFSGLSRAGSAAARQSAMGPGLKTLGGMAIEGATEGAQDLGSKYAQGELNPDRDTSGDESSFWNSVAGGAVGAGPFAGAGAYAEAGHNRVGGAAEHLGSKAGEAFDLLNENGLVKSAKEVGGKLFGRGKEAATDLMSDEDGKVSAGALLDNLKAGAQNLKSSAQSALEERSILNDMPPDDVVADDAKAAAWFDANAPKRHQLIVDKLTAMGDDPEAQAHLAQATAVHADSDAQGQALDAAAKFVMERTPVGRTEARANALGESLGKLGSKAGELLGKGVMATGKGALSFGKSVLSGAQSGMDKKNMQADQGDESFMDWRDRYYGVTGKQAADRVLATADPVDTQRAELAGSYVTDVANKLQLRNPGLAMLARNAAFIMSDMAMQVTAKGLGDKSARLNRLVDDLHGAFRTETPEILQQLGSIMGAKAAPIIDYMSKELEARSAPGGEKLALATRDALARQAVGLIDPASQNALMKQGVNLNTPSGREQLLGLMEDYADGIGSGPGARRALEQHFGAESVQNIMTLLNGQDEKEAVGSVVDDRAAVSQENLDPNADDEETTAFDLRAAEKTATKGAGPKVYGFHATANLRTNSERGDMFAPTRTVGEDGVVQRPALFVKGQQLFGGKGDAIEKKIADIKAQLQEDPEYPDHDNYDVRAKSVMEVIKESNMQPAKMLALFRDYMRMAYNSDKLTAEQREIASRRGRIANRMIQDGEFGGLGENPGVPKTEEQMKGSGIKTNASKERQGLKTTPGERREVASALAHYFTNRFIVVGEQLSNRDPSKMAVTEVLDLNREGQGLIERARLADTGSGEQTSQALSDVNVLMFKSSAVKSGEVAIPAGKLVNWVRKQRGLTEGSNAEDTKGDKSNKSKDDAYLNDVMEGIATLIGSGQVQGMPYKVNQFGKVEHFSQGIPSSLRLATKTYGAMEMGTEKRRKARGKIGNEAFQGADQEAVARDQNREDPRTTEGSIDDVADDAPMKTRVVRNSLTRQEKRELRKLRDPQERTAFIDSLTKNMNAEDKAAFQSELALTGNDGAAFNPDAKTSKTESLDDAPLDFFPKAKDGEVADEYANQRWLSRQTGASTDASIGPEPKGTAASSAEFRATKITEAFLNDPAKGQEMIRSRIRMALRPEYVAHDPKAAGKDQVVGGVHYIAPVAAFIDPVNLAKNNVDLPAKTIRAIQAKVANILLKGEVSKTEQLKIARLMLTDDKLNAMNVKARLERIAEGAVQGKPVVAKTESAPEVAKAGLPKGQLTPSGASEGRKLNAQSAGHKWMYHGTRAADEALVQPDGSLLLKPSKNLGGKTFGVSFTHDAASATDYATRIKGGGPKGFTFAGAKLLKIDRAALKNIEEETFGEWADYSGQNVVIPKGSYTIEPVAKERHFMRDSHLNTSAADYSFNDYLKDNYSSMEREVMMQGDGDMDMTTEEYLDMIADPTTGSSAADVAEAKAILRDEFGRGRKLNAQGESMHTSQVDEISVYGKVFDVAGATIVEATAMEYAYENRQAPKDAFYAEGFTEDGDQFSGWFSTMKSAQSALKEHVGVTGKPTIRLERRGNFDEMFNKQGHSGNAKYDGWKDGNARVATQQEMDEAKAYALKVLGPKIKVDFKAITGYSGEFIDATNVIEISTTAAAGTLGTLYHEAMHVFFRDFVKGNPRVQAVFESLINDPKHLTKLHDLLDGYPAAQAQLHGPGSGEERLAYTYQFWKAGLLQVDTKAHTWLQKVGKFFRQVLGRVRDSERALELFQAFDNGKMSEPSAAGRVIAKTMGRGGNALKLRGQFDGVVQALAAGVIPAGEILGKSVSPTARRLSTMLFTNPGEEAHGSKQTGMMNARRNVAQQYTNVSNRKFETMSEVDKAAVQKYLQSATDPKTIANKEQREAVNDIRALLDRFHTYMTDAGMKIGKVDNYYPVVWNPNLLNANKKEFVDMLVNKYAQQMTPNGGNARKAAERIWQSLVDKEGVDAHLPVGREDGVLSPFFASQEMRTLPWLDAADREKYLDKNMPLTLTRYFSQGAHAVEYFRRFGENGVKLEKMLVAINQELNTAGREMVKRGEIEDEPARVKWVSRQMRDISQSVGAMEGTLGKDISPNMRKFNSWMAVYQNIRVLPLALFSSFVDPLAMVARGAPMQAAYETFVYSMREVFRGWADAFKDMPPERAKDEWRQLAEHIGASEIAMFQHHVSDEYASTYMTPGAKKINDKMFTFNGMEAWNRGNRIMATKWAVRFIEKHVALPDKIHSERWLKELGLTAEKITMDDGKLVTSPHALSVLKGISLEAARKEIAPIHDALNRWVEGAVLTPNAAQRPAWSSDPNFATMFHLKQFSYSFHQTILKRATNEFHHGNMAPLGALAMFIPTMITADIMKGLIQGGGSLPPYMASMNAGDWFMHGAQRAGLSGIGVIGVDAANDWASLGGPAFEQIVDAARDGFGSKSAMNALPLHSLYGRLITGGASAAAT